MGTLRVQLWERSARLTDVRTPPARDRVAAAAAGDGAALSALWREHRRWVAAVLLAHMPRTEDLEDLLQDVAMTMVSRISELRSEEAFRPWLRMVAVNRARTAGRRRRTRGEAMSVLAARREPEGDAAGSPAEREEGQVLLALARELPEAYREPLLLRCLNEMSYRQIGQVLELPETTVETRIARARRMLRELRAERERRCAKGRPSTGLVMCGGAERVAGEGGGT